jgi:pimeloyl-ACP methyl ester carboxylesterase
MATFVLVPGFWLGSWAWRDVASRLRQAGHDAYPLTPTGLADRVHLATPEVDLETHVTDIVNLVKYEGLRDVVLVGHSGAGGPVTMAADRIPERLSQVVYVESGPLPDGMAQIDVNTPEGRELVLKRIANEGDGWRLPLPSWAEFESMGSSPVGLGDAERELIRSRATPQPARTVTEPVRLTRGLPAEMPKALVASSFPVEQVRELAAAGHPAFAAMAEPGWRFHELPTGHWPMFSRPADLADVLDGLSRG